MTSSVHVFAGFAPPTVAIAPPVGASAGRRSGRLAGATPLAARRRVSGAAGGSDSCHRGRHRFPALDTYTPPVEIRDIRDARDIPTRGRRRVGRGRSLAYTIAGVAAAAVGFAVVAIR